MTAGELIRQAAADGVQMVLTERGRLRLIGDQDDVHRWVAIVGRQYAAAIVAELSAGVEIGALAHERHAAGASAPSDAAGRVLAPVISLTSKGLQ